MKLLLFEWLVGGGQWIGDSTCDGEVRQPGPLIEHGPLLEQGKSMLLSLAGDLARASFELVLPVDVRLMPHIDFTSLGSVVEVVPIDETTNLPEVLVAHSQRCDGVVLIAPESDGCLDQCCSWLHEVSDKLISPDLGFIHLAADKQATCECLEGRGVRMPKGVRYCDFQNSPYLNFPLVLKPILGAGSEGVRLIRDHDDLPMSLEEANHFRIEEFVTGRSVSVSVLCGPAGNYFLPATQQIFDAEPFGNYVEAAWPVPVDLAERARSLAEQVVSALPPTRGYIGIDMILSAQSPELDCAVEVNPRLTMSYSRLSQISAFNLGEKMVAVARGEV